MIDDVHFVFRLLALSQALLLAVMLVMSPRSGLFQPYRVALLTAGCVLAFCCYLIAPFSAAMPDAVRLTVVVVATAIPSILWLTAHWFFEDRQTVPVWLVVLTLFYVTAWLLPTRVQAQIIAPGDFHDLLFSLLPQLIKLGLVLHVIWLALEGRDKDLVDLRHGLRFPLAVGGATLATLVIVVEMWAGDEVSASIEALGSVLMFALAFAANVLFVRAGLASKRTKVREPAATDSATAAERELLARVERAMRDRFYARHGATLDQLATELGIPAYRLRKVINAHMGHRNFNQFLNHYRITEASTRLQSESSPILTIALDVGFKSLSSFNAAFRAQHGMTPSAYRQQAMSAQRA